MRVRHCRGAPIDTGPVELSHIVSSPQVTPYPLAGTVPGASWGCESGSGGHKGVDSQVGRELMPTRLSIASRAYHAW